jgi:hypothetical protein
MGVNAPIIPTGMEIGVSPMDAVVGKFGMVLVVPANLDTTSMVHYVCSVLTGNSGTLYVEHVTAQPTTLGMVTYAREMCIALEGEYGMKLTSNVSVQVRSSGMVLAAW